MRNVFGSLEHAISKRPSNILVPPTQSPTPSPAPSPSPIPSPSPNPAGPFADIKIILDKYCIACHKAPTGEANVNLDTEAGFASRYASVLASVTNGKTPLGKTKLTPGEIAVIASYNNAGGAGGSGNNGEEEEEGREGGGREHK